MCRTRRRHCRILTKRSLSHGASNARCLPPCSTPCVCCRFAADGSLRFCACITQVGRKRRVEPADALTGEPERICVPVIIQAAASGAPEDAVLITHWPMDVKYRLDGSNKYMRALLECSPYPLCLFNFNGQLITCNPAAVAVFGKTIWLQSDIFGMSQGCLLYTSPSPRDGLLSRMPSSA